MAFYFNLPLYDALTIDQQAVLNEPQAIAVSGGPGTGKTVISLWRHIRNHSQGKTSLLLTYSITLEYYLKETAKNINENASIEVNRTLWWTTHINVGNYDEIIVDEAQDVDINKYQIINNFATSVSYGADPDQSVYFLPIEVDQLLIELNMLFPNVRYTLTDNFRNSYEIMLFVRAIFPNRNIPQTMLDDLKEKKESRGPKPILQVTRNQDDSIIEIIKIFNTVPTHNIAILVPLVTPAPNITNSRIVNYYYNLISDAGIECSKYTFRENQLLKIENVHVCTFKSAKGLEFDTVIIPDFQDCNNNIANLRTISENDYYVGYTRARRNLYLISNIELAYLDSTTYELKKDKEYDSERDLPF